jgi:ubiquinone/menaquinone biosynthesis C-methylase UbiE
VILYSGADHPPPPGFILLILIDFGSSIVVYYRSISYRKWIVNKRKRRLLRVIVDGLAAGFVIALIMVVLPGGGEPSIPPPGFTEFLIWSGILSFVGIANSLIVYWIILYFSKKSLPQTIAAGQRGRFRINFPQAGNIDMPKTKYYTHYEEVYAAALAAGVDTFNNPLKTDFRALLNSPLLPSSGRVLDLGCGEGLFSLLFAAQGFQVVGVDISPSAVEWAQQRAQQQGFSNTTFIVGDVTHLTDLPRNDFDLVLSVHCYHCLTKPSDRSAHLQEAWRVLKPGGVFLFDNMAAPKMEDMPQFRNWHITRKGKVIEDQTGVTTTAETTPPTFIKRKMDEEIIEFEIKSMVAMAHRFYSRMEHVLAHLNQIGFEILSAEVRAPDPSHIPEMKFIQGDNVIFARKPVGQQ